MSVTDSSARREREKPLVLPRKGESRDARVRAGQLLAGTGHRSVSGGVRAARTPARSGPVEVNCGAGSVWPGVLVIPGDRKMAGDRATEIRGAR